MGLQTDTELLVATLNDIEGLRIVDPACADRAILNVFEKHGCVTFGFDEEFTFDPDIPQIDFFSVHRLPGTDIFSSPGTVRIKRKGKYYKYVLRFIEHALDVVDHDACVGVHVPLDLIGIPEFAQALEKLPLYFMLNTAYYPVRARAYCWLVFNKSHTAAAPFVGFASYTPD